MISGRWGQWNSFFIQSHLSIFKMTLEPRHLIPKGWIPFRLYCSINNFWHCVLQENLMVPRMTYHITLLLLIQYLRCYLPFYYTRFILICRFILNQKVWQAWGFPPLISLARNRVRFEVICEHVFYWVFQSLILSLIFLLLVLMNEVSRVFWCK